MKSQDWSAPPNSLVECPVDGCKHQGELITKYHLRNEHGLERSEVEAIYGMPEVISIKPSYQEHTPKSWNSTSKGMML